MVLRILASFPNGYVLAATTQLFPSIVRLRRVVEDGRSYQGKFTGKRIDDNHYEWHFKGKVGDEENVEITGKYVRKGQ